MVQTEEVTPEKTALRDNLVRYELSSAQERADRDRIVATWQGTVARARDLIHDYLNQIGLGDPRELHKAIRVAEDAIESMDEFLKRAGGRRK